MDKMLSMQMFQLAIHSKAELTFQMCDKKHIPWA